MTVRTFAITGDETMHNPFPWKTYTKKAVRKLLKLDPATPLPTMFVASHVFDVRIGEAFLEIVFRTESHGYRSIEVGNELRFAPAKLRDLLARADARFPTGNGDAIDLITDALNGPPIRWCRKAPQFGWLGERSAFVLHDAVIGANPSGRSKATPRILPPKDRPHDGPGRLSKTGDRDGWQKEVASLAKHSSVLTLALSASFASLLLSAIEWPPFIIVLHGDSKVGKSTAALAAASVIGIGSEARLPNWNVTDAALYELGQRFNDLPLVLNGLESRRAGTNDLRQFIRSVTYILGDGTDTARHSSWTSQNAGSAAPWRTIVLVTSEDSFDAIAARGGGVRQGGERARAIDVPCVRSGDLNIVDRFPETLLKQKTKRDVFSRHILEQLRAGCAQHHGVALEPFVQYLLGIPPKGLAKQVRDLQKHFVSTVSRHLDTEPLNHAAKNFGVIYAGGILAVRAGLIPLSEKQLRRRIVQCFQNGLAAKPQTATERGLQQLKRGLNDLLVGAANLARDGKLQKGSRAASATYTDGSMFRVPAASVFRSWFGQDHAAMRAALQWLFETSLLTVPDRQRARRGQFSIESVRSNIRFNQQQVACVVFKDPRPTLPQ
jgi:Domain of unknown function (DUF927)